MTNEPRSLLRKPGEPLVCYCPPGICQAPKGFSGPCNRATPPAVMPAAPSDAVRGYPPLPKPTSWQIAIIQDNEYGQNIIGWRDEFSETSFNFSYLPKRVMFTTEQMRAYVDADRAALSQTMRPQAEPAAGQVTLTRAQVEELRAIIHNAESPLGNRLQDVSSRLYFALEGTGWTPAAGEQAGAADREFAVLVNREACRLYPDSRDDRINFGDGARWARALAAPGAAVAAREQDAVGAFAIDVEKMLCAKLGREWSASGMSVATLIEELASPKEAPDTPQADKGDEVTEEMLAAGAKFSSQPRATYKAMRAALTQPTTVQQAETAAASEVDLIEKAAVRVGMKSLMNHGAASCVYTEGCNGVSQAHLIAFAREVALHCVAALAQPAALQYAGPWCCEKGQAAGKPVCDECAAESAGYSAAMLPDITDDTPLETGEGDAR